MNDFPVIGDVSFEQRIVGSPGGKHCKSLKRNLWRRVVSSLKKSDFGQGMTYFSGNFVRSGGDRCLSVEIVSYYFLNVIKSIDKDSFLRKFDCEISFVNLREI